MQRCGRPASLATFRLGFLLVEVFFFFEHGYLGQGALPIRSMGDALSNLV